MLMLSFGCHFYCYYINKRPSRQYTAVTAIVITIIRERLHGCSIDHFLDPVKKNVIYKNFCTKQISGENGTDVEG
jgi:hypothetical protein